MKGKRSYTILYVLQDPTVTSESTAIAPSMLDGNIIMGKVSTHSNVMDMLTKSHSMTKFGHCLNLVGVC